MTDTPKRLIEVAFPLKQTSLDSVHEKNVRHGHISTLHIWPARRPLAACRAALIATLLPDPGNAEERKEMLEKLGGVIKTREKKKKDAEGRIQTEQEEYTEGGILHWGRESGPDLDWFRQKIREAYSGRAPKVLDPFAGGGAIPLEAMRLGCEATAVDINPVAWFILKCTLEYPQKLAGQKLPLPEFAVQDRNFMEQFLKSRGYSGAALHAQLSKLGLEPLSAALELPFTEYTVKEGTGIYNGLDLEADLAWHVRAWGRWVLKEARKELAPYYPTYADFEPVVEVTGKLERRPMTLVPLKTDGTPDIDALNAEFTPEYLANKSNPRWLAKPTVAYLWARTVTCKNCRATIPLLKTRWLCKKPGKRVLLTMQPNSENTGVIFGVEKDVLLTGKNNTERKTNDAKVGCGTMTRSGATCPCCGGIMTTEDVRLEGQAGRLGASMTAVVVDELGGKEYRISTDYESEMAEKAKEKINSIYEEIPFGLPNEPTPKGGGSGAGRAFSVQNYGMMTWGSLFTNRQLLAIGIFTSQSRRIYQSELIRALPEDWRISILSYLSLAISRMTDRSSTICHWSLSRETIQNTFSRFALAISWDFSEATTIASTSGSYDGHIEWIAKVIEHCMNAEKNTGAGIIVNNGSSKHLDNYQKFDLIITDPPYYDAIPYSDAMDFFYIWLRRNLRGISIAYDNVFSNPLSPKWNQEENDGELIDDPLRFNNDKGISKLNYETGMYEVFLECFKVLNELGTFVIVFANKQPDAWETLVSALIRSGFVVTGSWPIQTEMINRTVALAGAALASSVWLVCKKRNATIRPGWDNKVLEEMRTNITTQLRNFWDAGIRGPDFVWAATGPAMEAYSQYPVVKKANQPGEVMTVSEFLVQVRRMVVDFVVGRVLTGNGAEEVTGLDNITTYYLLHRHDFGINDAPAGPCILYAVSCGLSDKDLADRFDLLARRGGKAQDDQEEIDDGDEAVEEEEGSGSSFRLKAWNQRKNPRMGYDPATDGSVEKLPLFPEMQREVQPSHEIPLIDQVHRLMHLWKGGDVSKVNEYLDLRGLRRNPLFHQLLQALIELAPAGSEERSLLESISNHVGGKQSTMQQMF